MDWFANEELFKGECRAGHAWERYVAMFFHLHELEVDLGEQTIRRHVSEAHRYAQQVDLIVEGVRMEVKSRRVLFHTPDTFPYASIFVDTEKGWDAKRPPPHILLCISRMTGAMIWLPSKSKPQWTVSTKRDTVRDIEERFYEADRSLWRSSDELLDVLEKVRLRRRLAAPAPPRPSLDLVDWFDQLRADDNEG